jgi:GNAT superfamily N-acetyltransferase
MKNNIIECFDSSIIKNILNNSFITVANEYGYTKENAPTFPAFIGNDIIEKQINGGLKMYVYNVENQNIGCIGYSFYKDKIYIIERLAVLPKYRHNNVGRELMEYIENKIKDMGGEISEIHIVNNNTKLKEWYKTLGYKEIRTEEYRQLPFKVGIMAKKL